MKMKVYLIEQDWGEDHIAFYSKELGWLEYFDNDDTYSPFINKSKKDLILSSVNFSTDEQKLRFAKQSMKFTYLGDL